MHRLVKCDKKFMRHVFTTILKYFRLDSNNAHSNPFTHQK